MPGAKRYLDRDLFPLQPRKVYSYIQSDSPIDYLIPSQRPSRVKPVWFMNSVYSHEAIGISPEEARNLNLMSRQEDYDRAISILLEVIERLKRFADVTKFRKNPHRNLDRVFARTQRARTR